TGQETQQWISPPAKSKIRRHHNRFSTFSTKAPTAGVRRLHGPDDPAELSSQMSVPGVLKIFGSDICEGTNYKSVLATTQSSAKELVREALERYCLEKEDASDYVLCDVVGQTGADHLWRRECFRVVADHERPLVLQSLWKPKDGFSRRFEIQLRASVEKQSLREQDTVTAGVNAQARKLQKSRSRVASLFVDGSSEQVEALGIWRSLSEMDLMSMGREAGRAQQGPPREDPQAEADNHPPFDFPYFLLLQGYDHRQDFVVYLMSGTSTIFGRCREHCHGEDEDRLKVDILLYAPDVLPQHCCIRRLDHVQPPSGDHRRTATMLKPLHGAPVTRNGLRLQEEVELSPGDLVGLGQHYLFLFKDPTSSSGRLQAPPWTTTLCPDSRPCSACGSALTEKTWRRRALLPRWRDASGAEALLSYELEQEEQVLQEILQTLDPSGDEAKLTPAFLLILCIQHSAATFPLTQFRQLLLRIASQIQRITWEKTQELAAIQPELGSGGGQPGLVPVLSVEQLAPALKPLLMWMANAIELLHFVQRHVPQLLQEQQDPAGLLDSEVLSTQAACEEAMTVLEEVIMFTFQQSVYYLTKSMYPALPGLLEGNPFSEGGQLRLPAGLSSILEVLKETLKLAKAFQVHPDISLQLCAYLFFFINASMFNALMERGSVVGFYQWSRGVQIRANLDLMMDWFQSIGLGQLAAEFFQKLSAAVNLLATPKETLLQASWTSLRAEFSALNPAQLHHLLREYSSNKVYASGWTPSPAEAQDALRTGDILEGFDRHPPLILPSSSFQLELRSATTAPALLRQLRRLQAFVRRLPRREGGAERGVEEQVRRSAGFGNVSTCGTDGPRVCRPPPARPGAPPPPASQAASRGPARPPRPGQVDLGYHKSLALDPSCLLTPPNTPQGSEEAEAEAPTSEGARQQHKLAWPAESEGPAALSRQVHAGKVNQPDDPPTNVCRCDVFTVELHRGPHGLGLALVDGMKTPLRMSGVFVRSLVPGSPAARCQRLRTGDRILAVNGLSLVGLDYHRGRELIRTSGDPLRLLVAKMD
uniref:Ras association and DIL domains 2a n=1 Tax=Tetraodon nigroviridis TaxID=99883 RepID=H3D111_TETNG